MILILDKLRTVKELVTIEPVICLNLISVSIRDVVINDLLLSMACKVNLRQNHTVCEAILNGLHKEKNITGLNSEVQNQVNDVLSWCLPINSVMPIVLLLFLGNFSDKYKLRKPFMNLPILGEVLSTVACMVCAKNYANLPVEIGAVAHFVLPALFGKSLMMNMACYAYIADVSTPKMCIIRMAMLQVCAHVSKPIGMVLSGVLFQAFGFSSMFMSLFLLVLALCCGVFTAKDAKLPEGLSKCELLKDSANLNHVAETLKLLNTSDKSQRNNILYILTLNFIVVLVFSGEGNVCFWFVQQAFGWTNTEYAYFQAARSVSNCMALSVAVPIFSKIMQLHNLTIILISLLDKILSNIVCSVISTPFGLYASIIVGVLTVVVCIGIQAQSTKYVSKKDMGKMQSLLSIAEAIATCLSAQIYNKGIYWFTKDSYEQGFLHLGSVLFTLGFILTAIKYYSERGENKKVLTPIAERSVQNNFVN